MSDKGCRRRPPTQSRKYRVEVVEGTWVRTMDRSRRQIEKIWESLDLYIGRGCHLVGVEAHESQVSLVLCVIGDRRVGPGPLRRLSTLRLLEVTDLLEGPRLLGQIGLLPECLTPHPASTSLCYECL